MKVLRTPDKYFDNIKGYPFDPIYTNILTSDGTELRIHHIDEGPKDGPILLAMHGQPVWSYLYSRMIPILNESGIRVIAPDLVGYGKSDKPASRNDYSYQNQVDWMNSWLINNDLSNLTFFGQDWGGLIGLRMVADNSERFSKIAMGNTGLPYNPNTPEEIISQIRNYRKEKNIPFKTLINLYYIPSNKPIDNIDVIKKIGFVEDIIESEKDDFALVKSFIIKNYEFFIPLDEGFDKDSEIKKLNKELEYNIGFLKSVDTKLKNKNFISNAPKEIIDKEKQKIIDTEQKIKSIKKSISELS